MSRYKDYRGPKRRGYDEDYPPDYHTAERQPEYFSPRPTFLNAVAPHTMSQSGMRSANVRSRIINAPWPMCCAPVFPCANRKFTLSGRMVCAALRSLTSRPSEMALETSSAP